MMHLFYSTYIKQILVKTVWFSTENSSFARIHNAISTSRAMFLYNFFLVCNWFLLSGIEFGLSIE